MFPRIFVCAYVRVLFVLSMGAISSTQIFHASKHTHKVSRVATASSSSSATCQSELEFSFIIKARSRIAICWVCVARPAREVRTRDAGQACHSMRTSHTHTHIRNTAPRLFSNSMHVNSLFLSSSSSPLSSSSPSTSSSSTTMSLSR